MVRYQVPKAWAKMVLQDGRTSVVTLWIGLTRKASDLLALAETERRSLALGRSIAEIRTEQPPHAKATLEIRQCARCSSWIGRNGCIGGCDGLVVAGDDNMGWGAPIPRPVVDWLCEHGYTFAVDPFVAQEREAHVTDPWYRAARSR